MSSDSAERRGRPLTVIALVLAGVLILAVVVMRGLGGLQQTPLPVIGLVPPFELVDQSGETFASDRLDGHVWVASFVYTTCPGPCPRVVRHLGNIERETGGDPRIRIVTFSVDPEADTPEVLAAYARTHSINAARWKLLTGPAEQVFDVVRKGFFLAVERAEGVSAEVLEREGPVIHSTKLVIVDGAKRIRGYYDAEDREARERLMSDMRGLLRDL